MSSPWEDIEKIFVRKYSPLGEYGGWGIRFSLSGKGRALNISGNNGIQLVFSNNAKLLIGTNKPEEAAVALSNSGHLKEWKHRTRTALPIQEKPTGKNSIINLLCIGRMMSH